MDVSATIVTYKNDVEVLAQAIESFLNTKLKVKLYIVDNSGQDYIKNLCQYKGVEYIQTFKNIGFGAAHNLILKKSELLGKYHLVLNPDIRFNCGVIESLYEFMESNIQVGNIIPKVLYPDESLQILPKLLPTPFSLLMRVVPFFDFLEINKKYTLENYSMRTLNVPIISGCFSFLRADILKQVGFYDEKYFMYFEDFDLSRRIHLKYKTFYYPEVSIIHEHERGAAKSLRLFRVFVKSAIIYFNKYGWFFDAERKRINKNVLEGLK